MRETEKCIRCGKDAVVPAPPGGRLLLAAGLPRAPPDVSLRTSLRSSRSAEREGGDGVSSASGRAVRAGLCLRAVRAADLERFPQLMRRYRVCRVFLGGGKGSERCVGDGNEKQWACDHPLFLLDGFGPALFRSDREGPGDDGGGTGDLDDWLGWGVRQLRRLGDAAPRGQCIRLGRPRGVCAVRLLDLGDDRREKALRNAQPFSVVVESTGCHLNALDSRATHVIVGVGRKALNTCAGRPAASNSRPATMVRELLDRVPELGVSEGCAHSEAGRVIELHQRSRTQSARAYTDGPPRQRQPWRSAR